MRLGLSINGVLRNLLPKIEEVHEKYFPPEEGEEPIMVKDYDFGKWITFPKETVKQAEMEFNLEYKEGDELPEVVATEQEEEITWEDFLYHKCTFEVFGSANEIVQNGMNIVNTMQLENPEIEFIIIERELGLSIPSTLFFLSKTKCMLPNVKFVKTYEDVWEHVDYLITDNPNIINSKPKGKFCVTIEQPYNVDCEKSDKKIKSIKNLPDFLEELKVKN